MDIFLPPGSQATDGMISPLLKIIYFIQGFQEQVGEATVFS